MTLVNIPNANDGDAANAALINSRVTALSSVINGGLDSTNLADGAVTATKLATSAITNVAVAAGGLSPTKVANPYKFSVYRTGAWTLPPNTPTKITFETEEYDTSNNYDVATGRFTAPVAGFYKFESKVGWSQSTGDFTTLRLHKNGTFFKEGTFFVAPGNNTVGHIVSPPPIQLAANDYIEIFAFQTNATVTMTGNSGQATTYFGGYMVSAT